MIPDTKKIKGLWLTDFDGTIKPHPDPVCPADLEALRLLGRRGWFRAVVTGRSLFGFAQAWEPGLDFDALIFSSGVGLCAWSGQGPGPLIRARSFSRQEAEAALQAALRLGFGFFAYLAAPDNHHFFYQAPANPPLGFKRRLEIFPVQRRRWSDDLLKGRALPRLCQLLMMIPADEIAQAEAEFKRLTPGLSTVISSSPFGDGCLWLEIYPPGVDKGRAAAQLAGDLGLEPADSVASGNDYNDRELLDWAGRAFITVDAPEELRGLYRGMLPAGHGGLARAVEEILNGGEG